MRYAPNPAKLAANPAYRVRCPGDLRSFVPVEGTEEMTPHPAWERLVIAGDLVRLPDRTAPRAQKVKP